MKNITFLNMMNVDDIVKRISKESFLTINEAKFIVERLLENLKESLRKKEKIEFRGFGTFYTKKRKAKTVKLPDKTIVSPEHYGVLFKNSNIMLKTIS